MRECVQVCVRVVRYACVLSGAPGVCVRGVCLLIGVCMTGVCMVVCVCGSVCVAVCVAGECQVRVDTRCVEVRVR